MLQFFRVNLSCWEDLYSFRRSCTWKWRLLENKAAVPKIWPKSSWSMQRCHSFRKLFSNHGCSRVFDFNHTDLLAKQNGFPSIFPQSPRQHRHGCGCSIAYHHFRDWEYVHPWSFETQIPKISVFFLMKIPFSQQSFSASFCAKNFPDLNLIHCISFRTRDMPTCVWEKAGHFQITKRGIQTPWIFSPALLRVILKKTSL